MLPKQELEHIVKVSERIHNAHYNQIIKTMSYDDIFDNIRRITNESDCFEEDLSQYIRKITGLFHNDRGVLRTILMAIKPIKSRYSFLERIYEDLSNKLREGSKTGKI